MTKKSGNWAIKQKVMSFGSGSEHLSCEEYPDLQYFALAHAVTQSRPILWTVAHQAPLSMKLSGKNTGVNCHFLLQGFFLSKPYLLHLLPCRQIVYYWAIEKAPPVFYYCLIFDLIKGTDLILPSWRELHQTKAATKPRSHQLHIRFTQISF